MVQPQLQAHPHAELEKSHQCRVTVGQLNSVWHRTNVLPAEGIPITFPGSIQLGSKSHQESWKEKSAIKCSAAPNLSQIHETHRQRAAELERFLLHLPLGSSHSHINDTGYHFYSRRHSPLHLNNISENTGCLLLLYLIETEELADVNAKYGLEKI